MEYRIGNSLYVRSVGSTDKLTCPSCKEKVSFGVFSNMDYRLVPKFPLINCKPVYFLVCPNCASVYTVNKENGNSFKKGQKLSIGNFDLNPLKEFRNNNE